MIAIVGAGFLGLMAASACRRAGKRFVVFERSANLGGVWDRLANPHSRVQVLEPVYRFDHEGGGEGATRSSEVLRKARDFAVAERLTSSIDFGVEVRSIERDAGGYTLHLIRPDRVDERAQFDQVIVCPGELGEPRRVPLEGATQWRGDVVEGYSGRFDPGTAAGRDVIVIGNGAFGVETVRECFYAGARSIRLVGRRPPSLVPRYADYLINVCPDIPSKFDRLRAVLKDVGSALPDGVYDPLPGSAERLEMKGVPSITDLVFVLLATGRLQLHVGEIDRLTDAGAVAKSGECFPADQVVLCPGFERNTTFLKHGCSVRELAGAWWLNGDPNMAMLMNLSPLSFSRGNVLHNTGAISAGRQFMELILAGFDDPRVARLIRGLERLPIDEAVEDANVAVRGCATLIRSLPWRVKLLIARHGMRRRHAILQRYDERRFLREGRERWRESVSRATGDPDAVPYPFKPRLPGHYKVRLTLLDALVRAALGACR